MQIDFTISAKEDGKFQQILATVTGIPATVAPRLIRAMERAGWEIVGKAVKERFTGKGPFPHSQNKLGVRSGRLRRSIRCTKPQVNLRTGEISMSFGSNLIYFAIHEFGMQGDVQVKGHTRRLVPTGKVNSRGRLSKRYQERLKKKLAANHFEGAGLKTVAHVRPHKRRVKVPARAPLGTQLKHITTRAAFLRNMRQQLEPLLRKGR
jgi:hypothetical protein